ncbi:MAG: type II toxin-antitoxin system RelE/ParE family toxin [Acidobacteria bacterium]|nr:type II toxin-antitoxin system RelE/ParE family toxin [Acidobacteriota bacterium]
MRRLDPDARTRVLTAIDAFAESGIGDVLRLKGLERQWRLRVGDWRVLFQFNRDDATLRVEAVLHRSRAYR